MRDNERYLAFPPAVSQAFLVHSGEVMHKIVGHKKATLENKKIFRYKIWDKIEQMYNRRITEVHQNVKLFIF